MKIAIKQVDAFTTKPFGGNPAGVVTGADELTEEQMKKIAKEMNLSETAYVLTPSLPGADLRIRWFTPSSEVKLCGHGTIASFYALAEEGKFGMTEPGKYSFKLETKSGILPVEVVKESDKAIKVLFTLPVPVFEKFDVNLEKMSKILGTQRTSIRTDIPVMRDNFQLAIPLISLKTLFELKPDFNLMIEYSKKTGIQAFTPLSTETVEKESLVHTRCFVPIHGVNEDPVTGSSQGPLSVYLSEVGIINEFQGEYQYSPWNSLIIPTSER